MIWVIDANDRILATTDVISFGVDGYLVPGKNSYRLDRWTASVDANAANNASRIAIAQFHNPRPRLREIVEEGVPVLREAKETVERICAEIPDMCAFIKSAVMG